MQEFITLGKVEDFESIVENLNASFIPPYYYQLNTSENVVMVGLDENEENVIMYGENENGETLTISELKLYKNNFLK